IADPGCGAPAVDRSGEWRDAGLDLPHDFAGFDIQYRKLVLPHQWDSGIPAAARAAFRRHRERAGLIAAQATRHRPRPALSHDENTGAIDVGLRLAYRH